MNKMGTYKAFLFPLLNTKETKKLAEKLIKTKIVIWADFLWLKYKNIHKKIGLYHTEKWSSH